MLLGMQQHESVMGAAPSVRTALLRGLARTGGFVAAVCALAGLVSLIR